ncbi:MAG: hypothetical protein ABIP79_07975 [Chitinophagaceae bacterium]
MKTKSQLHFISAKIAALETAILNCHSNCLLKFPTCLAKTHYVDEAGCVWITVKKPLQYLNEFDKSFHVGLNYYKKGSPFYLNVFGIARLFADSEECNQIPTALHHLKEKDDIFLSVRIIEANYSEQPPSKIKGTLQRWMQSLSNIFSSDNDYYYHINMGDEKNYA